MPDVIAEDLLNPSTGSCEVAGAPLPQLLQDASAADLAVAVAVPSGGLAPGGESAQALALLGLDPAQVGATWEPAQTPGAVTVLPLPPGSSAARTVLLVGTGEQTADDLRAAGAALGRASRQRDRLVTTVAAGADAPALAGFVEGLVLGGYALPRWTSCGPSRPASGPAAVTLVGTGNTRAVADAVVRARATVLARNLAITPSNLKNPAWMATQARTVAERAGLGIRVWDEAQLREEGFGGLLAVGCGSATPPRLVQLDWEPRGVGRGAPRVVLVGKGITFDSGGLDLKPPEGMLGMKTDMSGSAIVLAVVAACRELNVPVRVTGLLALAENAVGASSYRPGDVVTQYGGTTVEIGNTDAEGRVVMADALAYADRHLDPDVLVDIATLTGAARVALARTMAPVFSTDDRLREQLVAAGATAGEPVWPYPLVEDYRAALDSEVADVNHIGGPGVGAGSIIAALFLREFVGDRRWAHLDIAGPGRSDEDQGILGKGATGFGARLLLTWLQSLG